jgi:putative DNA methylase
MIWNFMETNPFNDVGANWSSGIEAMRSVIAAELGVTGQGTAMRATATEHPLPDGAAACFFTDPPYYDNIPYADLSDFFFVWLKRSLGNRHLAVLDHELVPKEQECIVDERRGKNREHFETTMSRALSEGRRLLATGGIGVVVFAHKSTAGWESHLAAMIGAGWTVTGSWPIDTERPGRLRAQNSAVLASSIHLVCRPRDTHRHAEAMIGDWRHVLHELPGRIHDWMPRLAAEGVVGADAIFACLGPSLEIFSRYDRVERANGETVTLAEFLEHVWAAVSKEALDLVFEGADASGFEEDARLTAMWLWTISDVASATGADPASRADTSDQQAVRSQSGGFALEFDAARKIAQGLGAHLDKLGHLVSIRGDTARLLPVVERAEYLVGKAAASGARVRPKKAQTQPNLFEDFLEVNVKEESWGDVSVPGVGKTTLDRVHQSMILFATGHGEALRRFLVEDGVGQDERLWRLAQALSALYPANTNEKRWVDGVLARKKGLGF